jgi:hypothetical protein
MNLMTSEAALRLLPAVGPASTATDVLLFWVGDSALGKVLLARSAKGVCAILLGDDVGELEADSRIVFPKPLSSRTRSSSATTWRRWSATRKALRGARSRARHARDAASTADLAADLRDPRG